MKPFLLALSLIAAATLAEPAPKPPGEGATPTQVQPKPDPLYETRSGGDPNGINKWFMGRQIALVMGHQAADWLERPEREEEEKTDLMIDSLKFRDGEVVADIGVGSGYIARRIAKRIGEKGIVYGVDIQPEMLEVLKKRMAMFRIENVRGILGEEKDPEPP